MHNFNGRKRFANDIELKGAWWNSVCELNIAILKWALWKLRLHEPNMESRISFSYCKACCQKVEAQFHCAAGHWHLKSNSKSKREGERETLIDCEKKRIIFCHSIIILHSSALFTDNCICSRGPWFCFTEKSRKIKPQVLFFFLAHMLNVCASFFVHSTLKCSSL